MSITDNLVTWFDAASASNITKSGSVTVNGVSYDTVTQVSDRSGNNKHFTVTGGTDPAIFIPSVNTSLKNFINSNWTNGGIQTVETSNPGIVFLRPNLVGLSNKKRSMTSNINLTNKDLALFAVYQTFYTSPTFGSSDNPDYLFDYHHWYGANSTNADNLSYNYRTNENLKRAFNYVIVSVFIDSVNTYRVRIQGVERFTRANVSTKTGINNFQINGRTNDSSEITNVIMNELLIFEKKFSDLNQVYEIEGYLAWKWSLQSSLPNTHSYKNSAPNTILSGGGGGNGDPYICTIDRTLYKLPIANIPIRFYQGFVGDKLLTVNATLKTTTHDELIGDHLKALNTLKNCVSTKVYKNALQKIFEHDVLSYFEKVCVIYGNSIISLDIWENVFKVEISAGDDINVYETRDFIPEKYTTIYKTSSTTLMLKCGVASVYVSLYDDKVIRNGIFVDAPDMNEGNGVVINTLSQKDMTLTSLKSLDPVPRYNSRLKKKTESFLDSKGVHVKTIQHT